MTTFFELMLALPLDELKKRIQSKEKQIHSIQRDLDFMRRAHEQKVIWRQMTQEVLQAIADIQKRRTTSNMLAREEKSHASHHN
jgi:hypothetical protein